MDAEVRPNVCAQKVKVFSPDPLPFSPPDEDFNSLSQDDVWFGQLISLLANCDSSDKRCKAFEMFVRPHLFPVMSLFSLPLCDRQQDVVQNVQTIPSLGLPQQQIQQQQLRRSYADVVKLPCSPNPPKQVLSQVEQQSCEFDVTLLGDGRHKPDRPASSSMSNINSASSSSHCNVAPFVREKFVTASYSEMCER